MNNAKKPAKKIPGTKELEKMKFTPVAQQQEFILNKNTSFSIKESYNILRTNITFSLPLEGCKIIGVTSAVSSDGKSINCLNLAISFAQTESRVLLIDCDLRRPNTARLLGLDASPGVSNVIVGLNSLDESVRKTEYENLDVLLSGDIPPNPSELLGSEVMGDILKELSSMYDYIFIDTPPVNVVADPCILSEYMSGIVLVVRQGLSDRNAVSAAIDQLLFSKAKMLGFLLNEVTRHKGSKRYKKYSYYRYYSYDSQTSDSK